MSRLKLTGLILFSFVGEAEAEIGFGTRDSALSFTWLYGQAGDIRATQGSDNPARQLLSDGAGLVNGQEEQDPGYPFLGPWQASANWIVTHGYAVSGTRDDVTSIAAVGFSSATANGDNCVSELTEDNNRLRLEFTVGGDPGSTTHMLFKTMFTETGALSNAAARVDMLSPFGWIAVAIADSEGGSSYRTELALGPGLYRLEGTCYARVVAVSPPATAQYQATLSLLGDPEPPFIFAPCTSTFVAPDFDHDCDVDVNDFNKFKACATRSKVPYNVGNLPVACTFTPSGGHIAPDFDNDGDIDMNDYGAFQRCYSGTGHVASPSCFP